MIGRRAFMRRCAAAAVALQLRLWIPAPRPLEEPRGAGLWRVTQLVWGLERSLLCLASLDGFVSLHTMVAGGAVGGAVGCYEPGDLVRLEELPWEDAIRLTLLDRPMDRLFVSSWGA